MLRLLCAIMFVPILFCSALPAQFDNVKEISSFYDGEEIVMGEEQLKTLGDLLSEAFKDCRSAPAFCVSLDAETQEARKQGLWLQFKFEGQQEYEEMPYDTLLMRVEKNTSGVNLVRGNEGKFNGRCFYIDLEGNFNEVYDFLLSLGAAPEQPAPAKKEGGVI